MKKTHIFSLFIALVILAGGVQYVLATSTHSAAGWAWGGTPSADGAYQGMGWISFNDTNVGSGGGSYGVDIPAGDGPLSGYAWSGNGDSVNDVGYGWISFNGSDLEWCSPELGQATRSGNNITGGARILAIRDAGANAGGFDGCISLSGVTQSGVAYGVSVAGGNLSGYAWSSDLGWIDMSGVTIPSVTWNAGGCTIPVGSSQCDGSIFWQFNNVQIPENYEVSNASTSMVIGTTKTSGATIERPLIYGDNLLVASANDVYEERTVTARCADTNGWFNGACIAPPSLQIVADPKLIRSGDTTTVSVTVDSPMRVTCRIINAQTDPIDFIHDGFADSLNTYSYETKSITAKQIVSVTCEDVTSGLGLTGKRETTIDVVPVVQEI